MSVEAMPTPLGRNRQDSNDGNLVSSVMMTKDWGVSLACPGFTDIGDQEEAGFIQEAPMGPKSSGFFLKLAKYDFSTDGWPLRLAPEPESPASDSSSRDHSEGSSRRLLPCNAFHIGSELP